MGSRNDNGFSMLEMIITISIILIMLGVTFISLRPMLNQNHVNLAYDTTLMALRNTRNLAITQSNQYIVNFNPAGFPAGTIQIQVQPYTAGVAQPIQQVITYSLPPDVSFAVQAGFPTANTPDGFGAGTAPIDFGQSLAGEPLNYVIFMPDGSSQSGVVNGSGNYNSGVVYMTQPAGTIYTSRAITVWGATGRIRGWRLNNMAGGATWVQQ
jgi:prepilin-type N-terminal cleavage/methylation domain-containing protein